MRDVLCKRIGRSAEEIDQRVAFVMSGGCEGIISPHATIFVSRETPANGSRGKRLAFAMANTRDLLPEELGTITQVELVAEAVRAARKSAEIESTEDVHYVQVKCPLLTTERISAAKKRGRKTVTEAVDGLLERRVRAGHCGGLR
jgi:cyanuric acid amidohydrolase